MEEYELDQREWGVCGFIAVIQAAYNNKIKPYSSNFPYTITSEGKSQTPIEITRQLVLNLVTELNKKLSIDQQKDVIDFTTQATDLNKVPKTVDEILAHLKDSTLMDKIIDYAISFDVLKVLIDLVGLEVAKSEASKLSLEDIIASGKVKYEYQNTILGVGKTHKGERNGLEHWIYIDNVGNFITWGFRGEKALSALMSKKLLCITHRFKF